jgi:GT2 family glycosyltransferase
MVISVFICTYNRGDLIDGTLRAIIKGQTLLPDEIIIVNGGGANDCSATIEKWQKLFPNLREIKTRNVNLAASRNIGLPQCRGDIIIQTDDDAEPFADWIERLVEEHKKHPDAGVIGGDVIDASGKGFLFKIADATTFPHNKKVTEVRSVPGVNSSYKKEVINQVGEYDTTMFRGEDVDYNWRAIQLGWKILSFPDIKVYHHHRATWKGLYNQQYMYGRAYLLVRRKWENMYCCYPRSIHNFRDFARLCYFFVIPFIDQAHKLKYVKGFFNKLIAYPIMVTIGYNWMRGVIAQYFIAQNNGK